MYRNNWPLLALARYQAGISVDRPELAVASCAAEIVHRRPEPEPEAAFSSLISGFGSLPVVGLLKELLTKLSHG
jgi:hypothetical protein